MFQGERKEGLLIAYASAQCNIATQTKRMNISEVNDFDRSFLLSNPAFRFSGTCFAIRRHRRRCRRQNNYNPSYAWREEVKFGPNSLLFGSLDPFLLCHDMVNLNQLWCINFLFCFFLMVGNPFFPLTFRLRMSH